MKRLLAFILSLVLLLPAGMPAYAASNVCGMASTPDCGGGGSVEPPAPSNPPPAGGGGGGGALAPNSCTPPPDDTRPHSLARPIEDGPGNDPPMLCVNGVKVASTTYRTDAGVFVRLDSTLLMRLGAKQIINDGTYIWVASPTHLLAFHQEAVIWDGEWFHGPEYARHGDYVPINALVTFLGGRIQHDGNRVLITMSSRSTETSAESCRIHGYSSDLEECPADKFLLGMVYQGFGYKDVMDHIKAGRMNPTLIALMNGIMVRNGKYAPNDEWHRVGEEMAITFIAIVTGEAAVIAYVAATDPALLAELEQAAQNSAMRTQALASAKEYAKTVERMKLVPGRIIPEGERPPGDGWYNTIRTMSEESADYQAAKSGRPAIAIPNSETSTGNLRKWVVQERGQKGIWFDGYKPAGQVDFTKQPVFEDMKASFPGGLIEDAHRGLFKPYFDPSKKIVPEITTQLKAVGDRASLVWRTGDEVYAVTLQNWLSANRPDLLSRMFIIIDP